jgi:riboflavin synthase
MVFTGLVEDVGRVRDLVPCGNGVTFWVETSFDVDDLALGESIACNGVCLTAEAFRAGAFQVTAGIETLNCTTLGAVEEGMALHLERALQAGARLGGHLVSGHVDAVGAVTSTQQQKESFLVWIEAPQELAKFIAAKGSICVDGVSLTVNEVEGGTFRVNLIPHTLDHTHMGSYEKGTEVNLEVDLVARYVERLLEGRMASEPVIESEKAE